MDIKISGAVDGQHAVHIDGALSHHIAEDDVAGLLVKTHDNRWRKDPDAGAKIGKKLYALLNRNAGILQRIVDDARAADEDTHLRFQVPFELTQLPFE
ncbi:MAG: hypothetical protein HQL06_03510 [Nitrospirae bacterium]|nr:hypothetical protein [Nitrospirota bacterium]